MTGVEADSVTAFEIDEMPEELAGNGRPRADLPLDARAEHGHAADDVLKAARMMLKDDGMVGVVQHRAPEGASYDDYGARQRGYMRKQDVVAIFAANGFELAGESEINANPNDPANWEGGADAAVPPVLRYGDKDRAKYEAIAESDRMTLLFRKAQ